LADRRSTSVPSETDGAALLFELAAYGRHHMRDDGEPGNGDESRGRSTLVVTVTKMAAKQ